MKPYGVKHVAEAIGISVDTLYRTRQLRHERDGLPRPISEAGPLKWETVGFDAWLSRGNYPPREPERAPYRQDAVSDEEHRVRLAAAYGNMTIEEHRADLHDYYRQKRPKNS